jgi:hypothetical protein
VNIFTTKSGAENLVQLIPGEFSASAFHATGFYDGSICELLRGQGVSHRQEGKGYAKKDGRDLICLVLLDDFGHGLVFIEVKAAFGLAPLNEIFHHVNQR